MTVKEKLIACAIAAVFLLCVLAVYGYLVVAGKAPIDPFLAILTTLVTVVIGLVSGLAGHAAGAAGAPDGINPPRAPAAPVPGSDVAATTPPGAPQ
jgi:hypothetical protein